MHLIRSGGVLLHPTSLPGPYGIGDLGPAAHTFVDWLAAAGCKLWQVLPLGPTGYGDSPYQCFSAFAGNPYLISPDSLVCDGLLTQSDLSGEPDAIGSSGSVDYGRVIPWKLSLLEAAFRRFQDDDPIELRQDFAVFRARNAEWLDDYALFMALKESYGGGSWSNWPRRLQLRDEDALAAARRSLTQATLRFSFYQMLFFRQWSALRERAHRKGIRIIGDIPIFVAEDSADLWTHQDLFCLDENRRPTVVAGVPPDYFSATGQLWGNPLYLWEAHQATGYAWWLQRVRATLEMVDIARLDHFRGFAVSWQISAGSRTAEAGLWARGPGADLFDTLSTGLKDISGGHGLPLIAEDLGVITPDVTELRDRYRMPGMKILQYGFSSPNSPFLPHNYTENCVAYTGTHDNDTARGWLQNAPKSETRLALRYLRSTARTFAWDLIRGVWSSVAVWAIAPMQDLLDLDSTARMNYPSHPAGNWKWRMDQANMGDTLAKKLKKLNELYDR